MSTGWITLIVGGAIILLVIGSNMAVYNALITVRKQRPEGMEGHRYRAPASSLPQTADERDMRKPLLSVFRVLPGEGRSITEEEGEHF